VGASEPEQLTQAKAIVAERLRVDAATAEVLRAFEDSGVQSLLLKGASFLRWLYREGETRVYFDCDLLVRPGDHDAAGRVLRSLGFVADLDESKMPSWWREHGVRWRRSEDSSVVDLHSTLEGVCTDEQRLWQVLRSDSETLDVGRYPARVLSVPGRALHLALHAAQHGRDAPLVVQELDLALTRIEWDIWRAAAALAASLDATAAFAAGLRLVPAGKALADRLGLRTDQPDHLALRAGGAPPPALTLERFSRAHGLRARAAIVRHKLVPPPTYMRKWYPRARRGPGWLLVAYVWRPVWLLGQAPEAYRAWRRTKPVSRG
jgi:Uncharacterised nucleotidyltransferase